MYSFKGRSAQSNHMNHIDSREQMTRTISRGFWQQRDEFQHSVTLTEKTRGEISHASSL